MKAIMTHFMAACALSLGAVLGPFSLPSYADSDPIYTPWYSNLALSGWDVVSFYSRAPVKGTPEHYFYYKGVVWRFATQENRNKFISDPSSYEPQYGGYCAWAVAHDKLAKGDPKYWSLVDERLYINFNQRVKTQWEMDETGFIEKANQRWPQILVD